MGLREVPRIPPWRDHHKLLLSTRWSVREKSTTPVGMAVVSLAAYADVYLIIATCIGCILLAIHILNVTY